MSEHGNTLLYALTPNLGRSAKSATVRRYSAQMKSTGTFGDAELQEALAAAAGAKVEFVRYLEELRRGIIESALKDGKKVFVNGIAVVSGLRGSFSAVDGPFDPTKHKLAVTSYTYGDFQDCLGDVVPENAVKDFVGTLWGQSPKDFVGTVPEKRTPAWVLRRVRRCLEIRDERSCLKISEMS